MQEVYVNKAFLLETKMYFHDSFFRDASYLSKLCTTIYQMDVIVAPFKMKATRRKMIIIAVSFSYICPNSFATSL